MLLEFQSSPVSWGRDKLRSQNSGLWPKAMVWFLDQSHKAEVWVLEWAQIRGKLKAKQT